MSIERIRNDAIIIFIRNKTKGQSVILGIYKKECCFLIRDKT